MMMSVIMMIALSVLLLDRRVGHEARALLSSHQKPESKRQPGGYPPARHQRPKTAREGDNRCVLFGHLRRAPRDADWRTLPLPEGRAAAVSALSSFITSNTACWTREG